MSLAAPFIQQIEIDHMAEGHFAGVLGHPFLRDHFRLDVVVFRFGEVGVVEELQQRLEYFGGPLQSSYYQKVQRAVADEQYPARVAIAIVGLYNRVAHDRFHQLRQNLNLSPAPLTAFLSLVLQLSANQGIRYIRQAEHESLEAGWLLNNRDVDIEPQLTLSPYVAKDEKYGGLYERFIFAADWLTA